MISFLVDDVRFNFRAAAVIIDNGYVLLHRAAHEDFWSFPGGRVEAGETSALTIARELTEELGLAARGQVERLLWVVEDFYRYEGKPIHELGMYYLFTLDASSPLMAKERPFDGEEDDLPRYEGERVRLIFQWFPLDSLAGVPLYPTLLQTRLADLPSTTELVTDVEMDFG